MNQHPFEAIGDKAQAQRAATLGIAAAPKLVAALAGFLALLACTASAGEPAATKQPAAAKHTAPAALPRPPAAETPQREIFVPFSDLHVILSADIQRVFVTRAEYEDLAAKARQAARPEASRQPAALLSADYTATVEAHRARLLGTLVLAAPDDAVHALPLDLSGVSIRSAALDGKPAALALDRAGRPVVFVTGAGRHELKLEILAPLETAAAQRTLSYKIPTPPATRLRLTVPGHVEIKSGATVMRRDVDEQRQVTQFELLPRPGDNSLVLSLNNRQLRKERVVVAHAVLIDEITSGYERLHATVSLAVLHGATDQFRFVVPAGFEVTHVGAPQVARWSVATEEGRRILDVRLREASPAGVSLDIAAVRAPVSLEAWQLPKLTALDVAGQMSVVGLLLENRLKPYDLRPKNLISIDAGVLAQAMPASLLEAQPGAPVVVAVAAYYAPHADYEVQARFAPPPPELRATTNVLLTLTEEKLEARGGFALVNAADMLSEFDFSSPAGWQVTEIAAEGHAALPLEIYPAADGGSRIHVRLPRSAPLGESRTVYFHAVSTPDNWLDEWRTKQVQFPVFQVAGATHDIGAVAVQTQDDLRASTDQAAGLTPLDANDKSKYGLADVTTELAYRYDAPGYALALTVSRLEPRLTARAFSFIRLETDLLTAHYELAYDVTEARTPRLEFALPDSTPAEVTIRGLDGMAIKESSSAPVGDERHWKVLLAQSRRGTVRLAVDFQQPLHQLTEDDQEPGSAAAKITLPIVRALGVVYQSGLVAVEGSAQQDVRVETSLRKVDVGELAEADYQPGRRLLGAYGYGGDEAQVKVSISRPAGYELPMAIVERAELFTMLSASGRSQTVARFRMRAKALLIEVRLPQDSTLWSAYLDGAPTLPQREAGSLLIGLPATADARSRTLQLVYETPVAPLGLLGQVDLTAPKLLLRAARGATGDEVPLAELVWRLSAPGDFRVVRSNGTVFSGEIGRESPILRVGTAVSSLMSSHRSWRVIEGRSFAKSAGAKPENGDGYFEMFETGNAPIDPTELNTDTLTIERPKTNAVGPHSVLEDMDAGRGKGESRPSNAPSSPRPAKEDPFAPNAPPAAAAPAAEKKPEIADEVYDAADPQNMALARIPKLKLRDVGPAKVDGQQAPPDRYIPLDAYARESGVEAYEYGRQSRWALEGIRSLPIDFQPDDSAIAFQSLGEAPRLSVTLLDGQRFGLLGWGVALLVLLRGVLLTNRPRAVRAQFVASVLVIALALPWALPGSGVIAPLCSMAFYAACGLILYYLAAGLVKRLAKFCRGIGSLIGRGKDRGKDRTKARANTAAAAVGLLLLVARGAKAEDLPAPVKVPSDAIIVPYDPEQEDPLAAIQANKGNAKPFGMNPERKLLVPYDKYLDMRRAVYPNERKHPAPPAEFALAGGQFTAKLDRATFDAGKSDEGDSLLIHGHLDVDVLVDRVVSVPLPLAGGVLTKLTVAGAKGVAPAVAQPAAEPAAEPQAAKPAQGKTKALSALPAAEAPLFVMIAGPGRQRVELAMRFRLRREGGWRIAEGRLPVAPAAALSLEVAQAGTEIRLAGGADRGDFETQRDGESVETALPASGAFRLQWRAKLGAAPVDQGLAVRSAALLDAREDGWQLTWRLDLAFRGGQRESCTLDVPDGYLVEKVIGGNVRGWKLDSAAGRRTLEVTLLKAAQDGESFSVVASRRGAPGSGERNPDDRAELAVPVLAVAGAAQQSGEVTIRRSPLLELRTERTAGVSRVDGGGAALAHGKTDKADGSLAGDESPLGILPYQAYRFASIPFTIALSVRAVVPRISAELQTALKISERARTLESRIHLRVEDRPIYRLRIALPEDWKLDRVLAPQPLEWVIAKDGDRRLLKLYFAAGQRQPFDVVLSGNLGEIGPIETLTLPKLEVVDADELPGPIPQTGQIAVEADPALNVRAEKLVDCETEPLALAQAWLNPAQQRLARLALRYRAPNYAGQLLLSARKPIVHVNTYSNIRVTDRIVEETILLDFAIREAGIRSLTFLLPAAMRDARVSAPMLRQKTIETVGAGPTAQVRVRLDLQEEVIDNLRVLVENDRLLTGDNYAVPLPTVETGQTEHRYITLESAGRDEILVVAQAGIDPLSPEQAEWRMLTAMLGRGLTQAYLVRPAAAEPLLSLQARGRDTVETAGARIGLARAILTIDANGDYRGQQLYRVDNSLEQYLEVQLPRGARLWTAHVAGEPVKPAAGKAAGKTAGDTARIPLIKTAPGDADYAVVLKYGGQLGRMKAIDRLSFPLIHALNIPVELSQVELNVPETFDWFDFGGTMRQVGGEGDLAAGWLAYNSAQCDNARHALHGRDPFARARAINTIKSLQAQAAALKQSAQAYGGNAELQQQLSTNTQIQRGLEQEIDAPADQSQAAEQPDNRGRLNEIYRSQANGRANDVVNQSGENFTIQKPVYESKTKGDGKQERGGGQKVNPGWLVKNMLESESKQWIFKGGVDVSKARKGPPEARPEGAGQASSESRALRQMVTPRIIIQEEEEPLGIQPKSSAKQKDAQPAAPQAIRQAGKQPVNSNATDALQERESADKKSQRQIQRYTDRLARQQGMPMTDYAANSGAEMPQLTGSSHARTPQYNRIAGPSLPRGQGKGGADQQLPLDDSMDGSAGSSGQAAMMGRAGSGGRAQRGKGVGGMGMGGLSLNDDPFGEAVAEGKNWAVNGSGRIEEFRTNLSLVIEQTQSGTKPARPAVLASLDVDLHPRGVQYLFTTPRGDVEITARAVSASLAGRVIRLAALAIGIALFLAIRRRWRRRTVRTIPAAGSQ